MPGKHKREEGVYSIKELSPEVRKRVLDKWRYVIWDQNDSDFLTDEFKEILSERGFSNPEVCWSLSSSQGDGVAFWGSIDPTDFFKWIFSGEKKAKPFVKEAKKFVFLQDVVGITVMHESRYCHWNSMYAEIEFTGREIDFVPEEMRRQVESWKSRRDDLPRRGPKEWRPGTGIPRDIQNLIDEAETKFKIAEATIGNFQKFVDEWVKDTSRELEKMGYAEMDYRQSDENIIDFLEENEYEFDEDGERL